MGELSRIFGGGSQIEIDGKKYRLSPWTYEIQAEFEQYLEDQAWEACERASERAVRKKKFDEVPELRADTLKQIASGLYSAGSPGFFNAILKVPKHAQHFMYLLIEPNDPTITKDILRDFCNREPQQFLTKLMESGSDPLAKIVSLEMETDAS